MQSLGLLQEFQSCRLTDCSRYEAKNNYIQVDTTETRSYTTPRACPEGTETMAVQMLLEQSSREIW